MASPSQNTLDDEFEECFDQAFERCFDQTFDKLTINGNQEERRKKRKKRAYIERNREADNVRLWNDYFSELQRILKIISDDVLE